MENKLISIIIPVFNQQNELQNTLDSIEKQTYQNFEIIVVDDGSNVPVKKILDEWKVFNDPVNNLKIIYHRQENKGAPSARNKGFELSRGELVIFWDADIIAKENFLEKLYQALENNPKASFAYCNMYFGKKKMLAKNFDLNELKKNNYIHTTSLIHREDFVGFDESLKRFQDWDLWLTMAEKGKQGVWVDQYLFSVINIRGTMSSWLPSFAYKKPWKFLPFISEKVKKYEVAKQVVLEKHNILFDC